ncbi:MAG: helix-turn-helix domain-containing protein [Sphingomonadales bacterium]|nr:helix-turn-helix domain-containing protein [Sphingomonadales bacterium]
MKFLDIGEVAAKTGIRPSTLRYYEEIGLISSISRHGLRRQFLPEVLMQIKLIAMGKTAGFSLEEISGMFGKNGRPDLPRKMLHRKADEINRQIRELAILSNTLRHVADCPAPSHLECPKFRRLLNVAVKRGGAKNRKRETTKADKSLTTSVRY